MQKEDAELKTILEDTQGQLEKVSIPGSEAAMYCDTNSKTLSREHSDVKHTNHYTV